MKWFYQVPVRFELPGSSASQADALTRSVIDRVQREGTCWAGPTVYRGQAAMRLSISSWRTNTTDIERSAAAIVAALNSGDPT